MRADSYRLRIKGQSYLYLHAGASGSPENICTRPTCGWHAELDVNGLCYTRKCKEQRDRRIFRGMTPEEADMKLLLWKLQNGYEIPKPPWAKDRAKMRVIKSNLRK